MFRKAAIVVAALIATAGLLTGCSTFGYTGTGVVKEHRTSGKRCYATLATPDHGTMELNVGPRRVCYSIKDNSSITLKDGFYQY